MNSARNIEVFQAFEHASYNTKNEGKEGKLLPPGLFEALKNFAGEKELPYYSLTANGIRFTQFVGALQVGKYCIEVLPKIDRHSRNEESAQRVLIEMLRQSGLITVKSPTESNLRLKRNFILETYIQMFLNETWKLIYKGLIKTYRSEEGNKSALKGSLVFNKHIQKNSIHAERFYVRHTTYDREHPLNRVLYKTLILINQFDVSPETASGALTQMIHFPELSDIAVSEDFFSRIKWNRKSEAYRKSINIARLLLLNYHPDLSHGKNHVLALMFDMNDVWERWFAKRLKVAIANYDRSINIRVQDRRAFWFPSKGRMVSQKPDVIVELGMGNNIVLDTKWKIINNKPSEEDIRQMYAYNMLFKSKNSYLIYPGSRETISGDFFNTDNNGSCGLTFMPFLKEGKLSSHGVELFLRNYLVN